MSRDTVREVLAEFLGTFVLIAFGVGVVAQVVLGDGTHGEYLSINLGWALGVVLGAYVAAGSTITKDIPDANLAVARSRQKNIEGWADKRK